MAFDEALANRIRAALGKREDFVEKRMFGGLAFMVRGHMSCGIVGSSLMVRVDPEQEGRLLKEPGARPMDFTGRPMRGFLFVDPRGIASVAALRKWVGRATAHAAARPRKVARKTPRKRAKVAKKAASRRVAAKPVLLAGGNPRVGKADGDVPVQAYIAAMPGWKRDVGRRLDALVVRCVPDVRKAVKWNSPFYGIEGRGWFLAFHVYTRYVKVTFFRGASLRDGPRGGTGKDARWIDVHEDDLDEARMGKWIREAAALPGWGKG